MCWIHIVTIINIVFKHFDLYYFQFVFLLLLFNVYNTCACVCVGIILVYLFNSICMQYNHLPMNCVCVNSVFCQENEVGVVNNTPTLGNKYCIRGCPKYFYDFIIIFSFGWNKCKVSFEEYKNNCFWAGY